MALVYIMMSYALSCKAAEMTCRDPCELWNKLKKLFLSVSEASIDAKLTRLQNIKMTAKDSVLEYPNRSEGLVTELQKAQNQILELKMKCALFCGIRRELAITVEVIRLSKMDNNTAVSNLIIP